MTAPAAGSEGHTHRVKGIDPIPGPKGVTQGWTGYLECADPGRPISKSNDAGNEKGFDPSSKEVLASKDGKGPAPTTNPAEDSRPACSCDAKDEATCPVHGNPDGYSDPSGGAGKPEHQHKTYCGTHGLRECHRGCIRWATCADPECPMNRLKEALERSEERLHRIDDHLLAFKDCPLHPPLKPGRALSEDQ